MDQSLWLTLGAFGHLLASYNADLDCFRNLILQETSKTPKQRQVDSVGNKLDVQETDISLKQLSISWNCFSWCRFTHGRNSRAWYLRLGDWGICSLPNHIKKSKYRKTRSGTPHSTRKTQNWTKHVDLDLSNVDHVSFNVRTSRFGAMFICCWGQWKRNQDDNERQKSYNETCFPNS